MRNNYGITKATEVMTKSDAIAIRQINGEPVMSTLRIAEVTGKNHRDILKTCRNAFEELGIEESKFSLLYNSDNNQKVKHYLLPEREFNIIISGYSIKYRAKLIDELIEYRKELNHKDPLQIARETVIMLDREIEAQKEENRLMDKLINSVLNNEKLITFEHTTKLLYDRYGIQVGRNGLMKACRDVGLLMENNRPYQRYANWFKVVKKSTTNNQVYDVTLVYEDKVKLIYKHIAKELQL